MVDHNKDIDSKCIFLTLAFAQNAAEDTPRAVEWTQTCETSIIEILLECANDYKVASYFSEAGPGHSRNYNGTVDQENAGGEGGIVSQTGISCRKKKARRSCLYCQQSHRTCDDERPCNTCIGRGIGHICFDGLRKKPKYLEEDSRCVSLMDINPPFIYSNGTPIPIRIDEEREVLQLAETPNNRSPLRNPSGLGRMASKIDTHQDAEPSCSSYVEGGKSTMNPKNPDDWWAVIPESHSSERPASWGILNQQKKAAECDLNAKSDALNAGNQLGFAIKAGWSNTFL